MIMILLIILSISNQQELNTSNYEHGIPFLARLYWNQSSSDYPKAAFIMNILYGRTDVPFAISDLHQNYGSIGKGGVPGNIIIDNKYVNVGVFIENWRFLIPVPGGQISNFSNIQIDEFFPNGYIIKQHNPPLQTAIPDIIIASMNETIFCKICEANLLMDRTINKFSENIWWYFHIQSRDSLIIFELHGYLLSYNPNTGKGNVKLIVLFSQIPGMDLRYQLASEDQINVWNFLDFGKYLEFQINSTLKVNGYDTNLYIEGNWEY